MGATSKLPPCNPQFHGGGGWGDVFSSTENICDTLGGDRHAAEEIDKQIDIADA